MSYGLRPVKGADYSEGVTRYLKTIGLRLFFWP